ncbi:MAG: hypothetical protein K2X03_14015 [Bryobacteraceae bacterium]|nr:hypothetical protein [Bryobacteraceae bacterium]
MTVNLQIRPDVEATLSARARSSGASLEVYIQQVLEREAALSPQAALTATQKANAFRVWAKGFPADLPQLSLEDISRDAMYRRD